MDSFFIKNRKFLLIAIVVLAAFLIFFRLTRADIQHDDATYSFRSLGYFDYLASQLQTTPIDWFATIPWWARLSFHDHPPLVFLISHLFFRLFGVSVFSARLPFALAGLGSVILLYFFAKQFYGRNIALVASLLLAIFSYHTWASRISYLESIAGFFILLTCLLFLKSLKNPKMFIWFGVALGLTMLTKYTVFFLLPAIFSYLVLTDKKMLFNKYFILSIVIAFLIFSPVLIYNFKLYQTRGHFDLQFINLFNQDASGDWPGISHKSVSGNFLEKFINIWKTFSEVYSLPMYLLIITSVLYLLLAFIWQIKKKRNLFIILILLFFIIQFSLIYPGARIISLFNPFLAIILAIGLVKFYQFIEKSDQLKNLKKGGYIILLFIILGVELFYNLNTNIFYQPVGQKNKHYSASRWESGGFNQLEEYLIKELNLRGGEVASINSLKDLRVDLDKSINKDIFIYDPNLTWFSSLWYFQRWTIYYKDIFVSAADLSLVLGNVNWFDYFRQRGVKNLYYIRGKNEMVFDPGRKISENQKSASILEQIFDSMGAKTDLINNINGQLAFKVYKLTLN